MAHPAGVPRRTSLSDKLVDRLPLAASGQYAVRDDEVRGFFVVVGTRTKTYTIQTDLRSLGNRRTHREMLGRVEEWSAKNARNEAKARIGTLQTGARKAVSRRSGCTLRDGWERYEEHLTRRIAAGERSPRTLEGYKDCIERLLAGWLGTQMRELSENPMLVARRHAEITKAHGPYAANHAMRALRAIYGYARKKQLDRSLPPENPVAAVDFNNEERRSTGMATTDLPGWWRALQDARRMPNPIRREFHLFSLLSASRPDALKRSRWEHLSVRRGVLHFPDPKGGTKRAFDMPLSKEMVRCLCRLRVVGRMLHGEQARTWIFPAATPTGHISETKEDRADLPKWGGDLRQTYRTIAQTLGIGDMDIHLLMNHSLGGVNAGYITRGALLDHLRAQQERISAALMAGMVKQEKKARAAA